MERPRRHVDPSIPHRFLALQKELPLVVLSPTQGHRVATVLKAGRRDRQQPGAGLQGKPVQGQVGLLNQKGLQPTVPLFESLDAHPAGQTTTRKRDGAPTLQQPSIASIIKLSHPLQGNPGLPLGRSSLQLPKPKPPKFCEQPPGLLVLRREGPGPQRPLHRAHPGGFLLHHQGLQPILSIPERPLLG